MKKIGSIALAALMMGACNQNNEGNESIAMAENEGVANKTEETMQMEKKNLHDFKSKTLDGGEFDFANLKGKRVLIVNTASECGYTPQYEQLQELHDEFGGDNFTVIGFPSNDFGGQEPGSNAEIKEFCKKNFGVSFPMMAKTPVKGNGQHPIYAWLTSKEMNGKENAQVSWNFNKFLVDENGNWVAHYESSTGPLDEKIIAFAEGK